jgi:hypothetical protein
LALETGAVMSMRRTIVRLLCSLACVAGCDERSADIDGGRARDAAAADAGRRADARVSPADAGERADAIAEGCDPDAPFGAPAVIAAFADTDSSEPWISGDGRTLVFTEYLRDSFELRLRRASRANATDTFVTSSPIDLGGFAANVSQASLAPDGSAIYFYAEGEIMRSAATADPDVFAAPTVLPIEFPEYTMYPEYPRAAGGELHYSIRELNMRRSLYAHDLSGGGSSLVLYDAGDIFTYAVSSDDRVLYVTFQVDELEIYRAERSDPSLDFSLPQRVAELSEPTERGSFAVTGVTDDDCEVFGWVLELTGDAAIWHARRGR